MLKKCVFFLVPLALMAQQGQQPPPPPQKVTPPHHEMPPITPPTGPLPERTVSFVLDAEFLYWYATTTNLAYATKYIVFSAGDSTNPGARFVAPEKIYEPRWRWDRGTRVGLGLKTNYDGWDIYGDWTWYYVSTTDSTRVPIYASNNLILNPVGTEALASPWLANGTSSNFNSIQTRWGVQLNQFDLELGRQFFISPKLILRPFGGLRGHRSRMFLKVQGNYGDLAQELARRTQKFWAVGLLGGLESQWKLSRSWSLFIDWAFSLIYGPFDSHTHLQSFATNANNQVTSNFDQRFRHDDLYTLQQVYDLAIGIRWELPISQSDCRLRFDAGWENHLYPGYNHLDANVSASGNGTTYLPAEGDLTLSGVVLRGQVEF